VLRVHRVVDGGDLTSTPRRLGIIGVPSSAGAFAPGQEKAPRALREAGFLEGLRAAGREVEDHGDGPVRRWLPDRASRTALNPDSVAEVARDTAARVAQALAADETALVLGGDCTVGIGTVAGTVARYERVGLVYFDLHADLNVPGEVLPGALDWMGAAHMLGIEGACEPLTRVGKRQPLLRSEDILFFSYGEDQLTSFERKVFEGRGLKGISVHEVEHDPEGAARWALALFDQGYEHLLVHFDVDTVDFLDAPLSENTGHNIGLSLEQAMRALRPLAASEKVTAITITELNPDHGAEDGGDLRRFARALCVALS
jgi:arginase